MMKLPRLDGSFPRGEDKPEWPWTESTRRPVATSVRRVLAMMKLEPILEELW